MSASDLGTTSTAAPADGLRLVLPGRSAPAGSGVAWIGAGWKLFMKAPLMWVVAVVILVVLAVVSGLLVIGTIVFQILSPVFGAGFVVACRALERGGEFELEHLFAGFKAPHVGNLLIVGLLFLLGGIVILLVGALFAGFSVMMGLVTGSTADVTSAVVASTLMMLVAVLVMLALSVPLLAAYWFAPALVVMHGVAPLAAMKESFFACLRNIIPFILYSIVMTVLAVIAMIPLGLGFLVWLPLAIASTYAAYREIFTEEVSQPPVAATMV